MSAPTLKRIVRELTNVKSNLAANPSDEDYATLIRDEATLEALFCTIFLKVTGVRWSDAERVMR